MTDNVLTSWHVGPWTSSGTAPGEPLQPGARRTPDELNYDVIALSRGLGREESPELQLKMRLWQNELRPTHTRMCGVHTIAAPESARDLAENARDAFEWIAQRAPVGYRFVFTDAIYLEPTALDEVDQGPLSVDAVVEEARHRGYAVPAARLARSHVRPSGDAWVAGDVACIWAGPVATRDAAINAITSARDALVEQLRNSGGDDLAGTADRWLPVPVEA